MKVKKILCLLLALVFVLSVFVGCSSNEEQTDITDVNSSGAGSAPEEDTPPEVECLDIVKDGAAVDIVYSKLSTAYELKAANSIAASIKNMSGAISKVRFETENYDPSAVEIVVGSTNYSETREVMEQLGYSEGVISIVGNKIIILGSDEESYDTLAQRFAIALNNGKDKDKNIKIPTDYTISVSTNELVASLPTIKDVSPSYIKDAGDDCYVLMFPDATLDTVEGYISSLVSHGYSEYASNTIDNNRYYTYTNSDNVVNVAFTGYNKEMKVIVESQSDTALPTRESDNKWSAVSGVTTTISQLGLYYETDGSVVADPRSSDNPYFNGMSYVIRLKDGSFIVIDGGHSKSIDGTRLYNVMKKQAPDPDNIVIAAWFFTHGHSDHTGFLASFCQNYASKVKVEQFVYNFPSVNEINDSDQARADGTVAKHFKNVPVVKAHPGQVFHIRNSKITMLYTNDLWVYGKQELKTANEASLVFTVELEGKKFMVLGDYYDDLGILRSLYSSSTLKSDIMQVSHHGISNCGTLLYPIIAPEWALWPLGTDYIKEYDRVISEHRMNAYMKTMDKNKVFMAKDDIVILTLDNGNIASQVFETDAIYLAS